MVFYRALLRLYPKSFRAEYGAEMLKDFNRQWRDLSSGARVGLLVRVFADTTANALGVHLDILETGRPLRAAFARSYAGLHRHGDCCRRPRHRRDDRHVFDRRSCDSAAAAVCRFRPPGQAHRKPHGARLPADRAVTAKLPRLEADADVVREHRSVQRRLQEPGGERRTRAALRIERGRRRVRAPRTPGSHRAHAD